MVAAGDLKSSVLWTYQFESDIPDQIKRHVVKWVYTLDLGSSVERRESSSLSVATI